MINILLKELKFYGIEPGENGSCIFEDKNSSIYECIKTLKNRLNENKELVFKLWLNLKKDLDQEHNGECTSDCVLLFIPAIKYLYDLSSRFNILKEKEVVSTLKNCVNKDSKSFSSSMMMKVIEYRLAIEWLDFLLRRDSYICCLLGHYRSFQLNRNVVARGVAGPWANVDLAMQERVFEWDDIEEEVAGRERDKRRQPRYTQGYENYGGGAEDLYPSPGRYWREMNNEPYSLDSVSGRSTSNDGPYKSRKLLWV